MPPTLFPRRRSFLDKEAPPGYIPGIGRGATGFTTRSDIGTARLPPQRRDINDDGAEDGKYADADDDDGLLTGAGDKEDEEADAIYKSIDDRLKMRGKKRVRVDDQDVSNLEKISQQFVDLKKDLGSISEVQWANLPEVGDLTKRNKRLRDEANKNRVNYAAPDSLLTGLGGGGTDSSVDIGALTEQRSNLLRSKIDANFDMESDAVNQDDYLKEISALDNTNEEEVNRINTILSSYTKADPSKPEGWIARARLEEFRKNFENARKIIRQGCDNCPRDEEIWLENVRLNQHDVKHSKIIIADAVRLNSKSLKLWMKAMDLEQETFNKKRILRKALESLPTAEPLWAALLELEEDEDDMRKILEKALELIPGSQAFWLKLIGLQSYEDAKSTLNRARKALGGDNVHIWLTAVKLEFSNNPQSDKVGKLIKKAFKECSSVTRDEWFDFAVKFEDDGLTYLTTLLVSEIMTLEDHDYDVWIEDSKKYEDHVFVLKTILNQIVIHFPKKIGVWRRLIQLYKKHFHRDELYAVFENIIDILPKNALFWLMYSKEMWKNAGDVGKAKEILQRAISGPLPTNTDIWCAMIKLETTEKNFEHVTELFKEAKSKLHNERIWYKFVTFQRQTGDIDAALKTVDEGLIKFPESWKMYLQKSQMLLEKGDTSNARSALNVGTRSVPSSYQLWIALARVDEKLGQIAKARSDLDLGLLKVKASKDDICTEHVWLEKLELERRNGNQAQVGVILTKALKEFPSSSLLWTFQLKYQTKKSQRKTLYQDALKATDNNVRILILIGVNFWVDGKFDKAQRWFERSVLADEDYGDAWAWMYNFMTKRRQLGAGDEEYDDFVRKFMEVEPRHGDVWPIVAKRVDNMDKEPLEIMKLVAQEILV